MSKSKHTEAQMIEALKQVEAGRSAEEVGRAYGVTKYTINAWKSKYVGMDVSEAEEVKSLREENARLKKLVANQALEALARSPSSFSCLAGTPLASGPLIPAYTSSRSRAVRV